MVYFGILAPLPGSCSESVPDVIVLFGQIILFKLVFRNYQIQYKLKINKVIKNIIP